MNTNTIKGDIDLFHKYMSKYKDQIKTQRSAEYYYVDVVAEAYNGGLAGGEELYREEFIRASTKGKS